MHIWRVNRFIVVTPREVSVSPRKAKMKVWNRYQYHTLVNFCLFNCNFIESIITLYASKSSPKLKCTVSLSLDRVYTQYWLLQTIIRHEQTWSHRLVTLVILFLSFLLYIFFLNFFYHILLLILYDLLLLVCLYFSWNWTSEFQIIWFFFHNFLLGIF